MKKPKYITEKENGNIVVKTRNGDFELKPLKIKEGIKIKKKEKNTPNKYDIQIEKIQKSLVDDSIKTTDIHSWGGNTLTRLSLAETYLNSDNEDFKILDNEDKKYRIKLVSKKGDEFIFEEKNIQILKSTGVNVDNYYDLLLRHVCISSVDPILKEKEVLEMDLCYFNLFSIAMEHLYYDDEEIELG